jgi:hypothetical protein
MQGRNIYMALLFLASFLTGTAAFNPVSNFFMIYGSFGFLEATLSLITLLLLFYVLKYGRIGFEDISILVIITLLISSWEICSTFLQVNLRLLHSIYHIFKEVINLTGMIAIALLIKYQKTDFLC